MTTVIQVIHVTACILLVLVVLIQSGKGAEISASFAGSSQTVFGASGGANFFTKFTAVMAGIFILTSLALTVIGGQSKKSVFENAAPANSSTTAPAPAPAAAPVAPAPVEKKAQ
jgi:preprotein translocase subunit SecG